MRVRDAGAAVVALLAVRLASDVGDPSTPAVSATFEFYTEYASHYHPSASTSTSTLPSDGASTVVDEESSVAAEKEVDLARPIAVDFDGDGAAESLVVPMAPTPYRYGNATAVGGGLRVLDLSPLRARAANAEPAFPLFPRVSALYLAPGNKLSGTGASLSTSSVAVRLAAGYVAHNRDDGGDDVGSAPQGLHVAALWNDGCVTLHSGPGLDLVWRSTEASWSSAAGSSSWSSERGLVDFQEAAVVLTPSLGANGAVIVGARVAVVPSNPDDEGERRRQPPHLAYYALDARNGDLLWKHDETRAEIDLVGIDGKAHLHSGDVLSDALHSGRLSNHSSVQKAAEDCLKSFRTSLLDPSNAIFPHFWHQRDDTSFSLAHFERNKRGATVPPSMQGHVHKNHHYHSHHDKANVLVSHGRAGIEVLSLPDGRPVCHLSLREGHFYADINHDGTLDHLQFLSGDLEGGRPFVHDDDPARIHDLFRPAPSGEKAGEERGNPDKTDGNSGPAGPANFRLPPCYAVALSGLSAREQLFNAPLCHNRGDWRDGPPSSSATSLDPFDDRAVSEEERRSMHRGRVRAASPLPVEGRRRPRPPPGGGGEGGVGSDAPAADVVFAVNAGVVTRYDSHGRMIWQAAARGMPRWGDGAGERVALVGRIDYARRSRRRRGNGDRPILISGERDFVVLSSSRGKRLASAAFPQQAVAPPLLVDVNGDGTTDVLVISTDAIWGYTIRVRSGSSAVFVMICLFIMSILVVWTIREVGRTTGSDRRSTDV